VTAFHEAGHAAVAWKLKVPIEFVSIRPSQHFRGFVSHPPRRDAPNGYHGQPVFLWLAKARRAVEATVAIRLAGTFAEQLVDPLTIPSPTDEDQVAATQAARELAGLTPRELERLAVLEDPSGRGSRLSNREVAWDLARGAADGKPARSCSTWKGWCSG
jgi:hypothetical protein